MGDFFNRVNPQTAMLVGALLLVLVAVVVIGVVAMTFMWRNVAQHNALIGRTVAQHNALIEQEMAMKRDMIARGLSADEIERVLRAGSGGVQPQPSAAIPVPKAQTDDNLPGFAKARLIQTLVEHEVPAADVEQILRVLAECADDELPAKVAAVEKMIEFEMDAGDVQRVIRAFHRGAPVVPAATAFRE